MTALFDAHNHLHDIRFRHCLEDLPAAMQAAGIKRCVVNGTCEEDWQDVLELSELFPDLVLPSLGLHPWKAATRSPAWDQKLESMLQSASGSVFLGECGLDRWMKDPDLKAQTEVFTLQLKLATKLNLPLSIHCLRAWGPLLEILRAQPCPARGFLLHSYGGSPELVDELVSLGAYFSFSGPTLAPRRQKQRHALNRVPVARLLCETDAPDMVPPARFRSHEVHDRDGLALNHPANLAPIVNGIGRLLGHEATDFASILEQNFHTFFGLSQSSPEKIHGM